MTLFYLLYPGAVSWQEMLLRKRPGYFSGCCSDSKWGGARKRFKWDLFAEMMPNQADKCDEVPSWLKSRLGCTDVKFKGPRQQVIPDELLQIADAILLEECKRGLEMDSKSVHGILTGLLDIYNEEATEFNQDSETRHLERVAELKEEGRLSTQELEAIANAPASQIPLISKDDWCNKKMDYIVSQFCRKWGYSQYRQERPSKHLSREHPSMKQLASYIQNLKNDKVIDPRLMFNWDQVWTCFLETFGNLYHIPRSRTKTLEMGNPSNIL